MAFFWRAEILNLRLHWRAPIKLETVFVCSVCKYTWSEVTGAVFMIFSVWQFPQLMSSWKKAK